MNGNASSASHLLYYMYYNFVFVVVVCLSVWALTLLTDDSDNITHLIFG